MPAPDEVSNARVDARLGERRPLAEPMADHYADLLALRREWESQEATPVLARSRTDGMDQSWGNIDLRTLVRGEESGGRFSVHSFTLPAGAGLPPHHLADAQVYYCVTDGVVELTIGNHTADAAKYALAYCPQSTTQAFINRSGADATILVIYAPGGAERAFEAARRHWLDTQDKSPEIYAGILGRFGFNFSYEPLDRDTLTNDVLPIIAFEFKGEGDLEVLREKFAERPAIPRLIQLSDAEMRVKPVTGTFRSEAIRGDDTGGHGMINMLSGAPGMNAPPHYQPTEDEFFFILDGTLQMTIGTVTEDLLPGAMAYCPKNCTHGFINVADTADCRFFTLNSPAGHERALEVVRKLGQAGAGREQIDEMSRAGGFIFKRLPEFPQGVQAAPQSRN